MRNFINNSFGKVVSRANRSQISEILDSDEDKVINQYKVYLNYMNSIKKDLIQRSAEFVGYKKRIPVS